MLARMTMWVDPGGMTGIARYWTPFHAPHHPVENIFEADEFGFYDACEVIRDNCKSWGTYMAIGWERFTITGQTHKKTPQHDAMHVIGVCRYMAMKWECRILPEAQQGTPSKLEAQQLKAIGWWMPGKDDAQSAAAHMLRYMLKNNEVPPREAEILAQISGR